MTFPHDPQQPYGEPLPPPPGSSPSYGQSSGYGQQPSYGEPGSGGPYGQPASGGPASGGPSYGQPSYGQPSYGQPSYGDPSYGQPAYGQQPYGQPPVGPPGVGQAPYGAPGHGAGFGAPPYGQVPPPKKSSGGKIALAIVGGIVALCLVFGIIGAIFISNLDSGSSSGSSSDPVSQGGREVADQSKINQAVRDGNAEFTVKSVKCEVTSVGGKYTRKTPQGQFCVVSSSVKNVGNAPLSLSVSTNTAYNASGQEFRADIGATISANDDSSLFISDLNPGNSTAVNWVFDLPKGQTIARLQLHESFSSTGVDVTVA
ncbi:DUF4352 domain-containing protein [Cryptosporangium phraense]|uniref:DUF4352 domain-containing protein n=1 Tax=Cryptosporangium phraense TaxID=2593070 RepID=A0A545AH53_9ACTN|nr:DUF4352 domain-containing protein [Cryptosporangium phraense]TQS40652.1 DUF4352 domain-containing protein [Cryptosporangium phraense]